MHATSLIAATFALVGFTVAGVLPTGMSPTDMSKNSDSSSKSLTVSDASQECGNDQTISCCNSVESDNALGALLGANVADGLLGGNCQPISLACESDLLKLDDKPFVSECPRN